MQMQDRRTAIQMLGAVAAGHELELHELSPRRASLEEVYLAMIGGAELRRR